MFKIISMALGLKLGEEFQLKPRLKGKPYNSVYRFTDSDIEFKFNNSTIWKSITRDPMQHRIFHSLLCGLVIVVKGNDV